MWSAARGVGCVLFDGRDRAVWRDRARLGSSCRRDRCRSRTPRRDHSDDALSGSAASTPLAPTPAVPGGGAGSRHADSLPAPDAARAGRAARSAVGRRSSTRGRRGGGEGRGVSQRRSRHQRRIVCGLGGRMAGDAADEVREHDRLAVVVRPAVRPRSPRPRGAAPARRTSRGGAAASAVPIASTSSTNARIGLASSGCAAQPEALERRRQRRQEVAAAARVHERRVAVVLAERDRRRRSGAGSSGRRRCAGSRRRSAAPSSGPSRAPCTAAPDLAVTRPRWRPRSAAVAAGPCSVDVSMSPDWQRFVRRCRAALCDTRRRAVRRGRLRGERVRAIARLGRCIATVPHCTGRMTATRAARGYPAAMTDRPYRVYRGGQRGRRRTIPTFTCQDPVGRTRRAAVVDRAGAGRSPRAGRLAARRTPSGRPAVDRRRRRHRRRARRVAGGRGAGSSASPWRCSRSAPESGSWSAIWRSATPSRRRMRGSSGSRGPRPSAPVLDQQSGLLLSKPTTILVMGRDRNGLSDSLQLIRVDPGRHLVSTLAIPRDLKVDIPGRRLGQDQRRLLRAAARRSRSRPSGSLTGVPINHVVLDRLPRLPQAGRRRRWHRHLQQGARCRPSSTGTRTTSSAAPCT